MYNVLKTKSSPSEEQSLSRQTDHANKLIRQIESTIEHGEYARAKRFTLNDDGACAGVLRSFFTPRISMHMWAASTTTSAPRGSSVSMSA